MTRGDVTRYRSVRDGVQTAFRFPTRLFQVVDENTGVRALLIEAERKTPSAVSALAQTVLKRTKTNKDAQPPKKADDL